MGIADDEVMISYDVEALYTSLPINRVLTIVRQNLEKDGTLEERTPFGVDDIIQLLEYCLKSTFFSFRGRFYHLNDGVAMGSPVSSVVANLFMEAFEEEALRTAKERGVAPKMWDRYVDDVFALSKRQHVTSMLNILNAQDEQIRFTSEEESENRLPFLDVTVGRREGNLTTSVYRKGTHTNRVLSFDSHHPLSAKKAVIISLFDRTKTHFKDDDHEGKKAEKTHLFALFEANGYPKQFVIDTLRQCETNRRKKAEKVATEQQTHNGTVVLPYVRGLSEQIKRVIAPLGIRVVSKAEKWQWRLCSGIKDPVPREKKNGVVYQVSCNNCEETYVGETLRSMKTRMSEHARHARNGRIDLSAVAEHARMEDHAIDWEGAKILDREQGWHARKVKEALFIKKTMPEMNKDKGMELSAAWLDLVENHGNREKKK